MPSCPVLLRATLTAIVLCGMLPVGGKSAAAEKPPRALKLHVPSPDWRDQIIYFVLTDRFADGDPTNNDQGAGEYAAGQRGRYNGGDLRGITQRLAYIRGLGATALWITPPVANQWLDPAGSHAGYHGYWAENFTEVDRHLGTLADYQALSHALHTQGMHLVQDIVVNHTGNYFSCREVGVCEPHNRTHPSQSPFDLNDARDPPQRAAAIYHWTPDVADYTDKNQELNFQMSGLDDLNTENPVVRRALRQSYGHWIRAVGVDAFRVDTAFYVPPVTFADFLNSTDPAAPGINTVARQTGRRHFHVFGEGFGIDKPYQDREAAKIESYMRGPRGEALLPGMLNFPLYGALGDAFARGRPPAELGHRITRMMQMHARPHLMPSFVDNHDVDRFLAGGNTAGLRQALLALMTLPGIPVIYYGTEQGFTEQRAAMFAAGWGSGGRDRYDTTAPLYRDIAAMAALRLAHRVFSRGTPTVRQATAAQPGALAWTLRHGGQTALAVFNTSDSEALLAGAATGLPPGTVLRGLYGLEGRPARLVTGAQGQITLRLPPRSGQVWLATSTRQRVTSDGARLTLDTLAADRASGDFSVSGSARGAPLLQMVVDGDLASAISVRPDARGRWQALVDTSGMVDAAVRHTVTAWADGGAASQTRTFQVDRPWLLQADVADPAGDDTGPTGDYRYPTDPSWGANRQMDLRGVKVATAGGALRLELQMHRVTASWNPANGFDHVNFTVFIELPGQPSGSTVMPLQDANLPEGMRWHRRLRVGGWSNALFGPEGATAANEGRPVTPAAGIQVDAARHTVSLTLPAAALGHQSTLSGARIYITTWDYDGGYRALTPEPRPFSMGSDAGMSAKVMDASAVIVLP